MATGKRRNSVDDQVAAKIRALRIQKEISQADLAKASGIKQQRISKLEDGIVRHTAGTLYALAKGLGVPVATFFKGVKMEAPQND